MNRSVRDARSLYAGGVAGIAFLLGFAPFVNLVFSVYSLLAVIAAAFGALFLIIIRLRQGASATRVFIELVAIGAFVFVMLYGITWYFISYMPAHPDMWVIPLAGATRIPK